MNRAGRIYLRSPVSRGVTKLTCHVLFFPYLHTMVDSSFSFLSCFSAEMDGREFDGARVVVQPGRGHRPNGPKYATRRTEHRITVEGLDSHTSWQDLKVAIMLHLVYHLIVSVLGDTFR